MKRYMFTILLVLSVGIALPHMWKKIIESNGELFAKVEGFFSGTEEKDSFPGTDVSEESSTMPTEENADGTEGTSAFSTEEMTAGTDETSTTQTEGTVVGTDEDATDPTEGTTAGTDENLTTPTDGIAGETSDGSETEKTFEPVDITYWEDALFIGDSRTVGLSEYADLGGADVFASSGMSVYKVFSEKVVVPEGGKKTLEEMLTEKQYGKIYIMMGINELGYNHENTVKKFGEMYDKIQELQPDAVLFIGANLHVTGKKSASDKIFNNEAINRLNQAVQEMTDNKTRFYVDVNEVFDDENGNLDVTYTVDESHVLGKYYAQWAEWLLTKGIQ